MTRTLLAALFALASCTSAREAPKEPELQLRSYKVPPGAAQQLRAVIRAALFLEKDRSIGSAQVTSDGQLLVLGAPAIQKGVEQLVADYPARGAPPSIELTYWLVRGKPGNAAARPELQEIAAALAALPEPKRDFELVERLRLTSMSAEHAQVEGRLLRIQQNATLVGDRVVADLNINSAKSGGNKVETRVQLQPGQLLVLAEMGAAEGQGEGEVFYVVRASVAAGR
jgi:hypothetical protein